MKKSFYRGKLLTRSFTLLAICAMLAFPARALYAQKLPPEATSISSYVLDAHGILDTWGDNSDGELGIGNTTTPYTTPQEATLPSGVTSWTAVAGGGSFTLAIGSDGNLYAWGDNTYGQLGIGNTTNPNNSPVEVTLPSGVTSWTAVAAGHFHSLAIGNDGNLYAWGDNSYGECGTGNTIINPWTTPQKVILPSGVTSWTAAAAGERHSLAIGSDGNLYAWGWNSDGQLGIGNTTNPNNSPVEVTLPSGVTSWTAVSAGYLHSLAIGSDGNLYAWGYNHGGELGNGNTTTPYTTPQKVTLPSGVTSWTGAAAGYVHNLAIGSDGNLYAWGDNYYGELGNGNNTTPDSTLQKVTLPVGVTRWNAAAAGYQHSLAIGNDGNLYSWGWNGAGELGINSSDGNAHSTPVQVFPVPPTLASPSNGSTGLAINPTLSWNASLGATSYELQVSTSSTFGTTVYDTSGIIGTSKVVVTSLSNNTPYYWRVDATNPGGTSGWSTPTYSFTTIVAAPPAPTLSSPTNGATGVAINPTLSWNASAGAATYELQVSTSSTFGTTVYDTSGITGTSKVVVTSLSNNTLYYWRVDATNAGGTSGWSTPAYSFTTIVAAPPAPTLSSPTNGATGVAINPTLSWNASAGAATYELQVSTSSTFATTVYDNSTLTGTSQAISGLSNNTLYYWRVDATNAGGTSGWSTPTWSFTTIVAAPPTPTLSSPTNGATGISTSPVPSWNASAGATSYHLQVSTDPTFTTTFYDNSTLTGTSQAISGLSNNTLYYWRVDATNAGGTSGWSTPTWSFTTIVAAPPTPTLSSPTNGATGISTSPVPSWNASAGATSYHLQVSTDPTFTTTFYDNSSLTGTSQVVSGLSNNALYYWRVDATNAGGTSGWSTPTWSFTTVVAAPPAPTLSSPANGATGVAINPTLSWNASAGAATYELQVSTSSTFATTVYDNSTLTGTSQAISGLSNNTLYYWRVDATNAGGTSAFSTVDSFTTIIAIPMPPMVLLPANGSSSQRADTLVFKWNSSITATKYLFQLSGNSAFSSYVVNDSNVTNTTRKVTGLANLTKYFCRVSAYNAGGYSAFSTVDSFTTIIAIPAPPVLVSPVNTSGQPRRTMLEWNPSTNASKYHLQIASDSAFSTIVFDTTMADASLKLSTPLVATTKYYWHVSAIDTAGTSDYSATANFKTGTGIDAVDELSGTPKEFALFQNYPNPFNPSTTIRYDLSKNAYVKVTVYDILGRVVANLVDGVQSASKYSVKWNPSGLSSGIYFCRIQAQNQDGSGKFTSVKKLLYMK